MYLGDILFVYLARARPCKNMIPHNTGYRPWGLKESDTTE